MEKKLGEREIYIPFAAAAKITRLSEKRIRNWLDNAHVRLDADERRLDTSKHRRFSRLDLIRLALVGRLTALGFSAERASKFIETQILYAAIRTDEEAEKTMPRVPFDYDDYAMRIVDSHDEDNILDALRGKSVTMFYDGHYEPGEPDSAETFMTFLHRKHEDLQHPKAMGGGQLEKELDTRIVVKVWLIAKELNEELESAGLI
jgi:DNA-binding transcriptional MerR regulator